jgi:CRP-like cAMP-binding protein
MASSTWDLLEDLSEAEVEEVRGLGEHRALGPGEVLFDLGDEARGIFLLENGRVKLTLPLSVGDRKIDAMVGERIPGHLVGWSGLIPPHRFTVKATCVEDTRILAVPRKGLQDLFDGDPALGYKIFSNAARIVGQRLQVFQTLWIREMQHVVKARSA